MTTDKQSLAASNDVTRAAPLRVMALRGVDGAGGGADKIILRNATQLDPNVVQMSLCFMRHRDDTEFDFDDRSRTLGLDYHEVMHRGATDRSVLPQLRQLAQQLKPHIIHSHDYKANFFATQLARHSGVLRLATSHGWTGDAWRERALYYPADKLLLSRFPRVIAVSDQIRETLVRWGAKPERVRVLLNGVDPAAYQPDESVRRRVRQELGIGSDESVLGAVGRVERQKRFDVLLDAIPHLSQSGRRFRLLIAGDGSLLPRLRDQVRRMGLSDRVTLLGHCPNMREIYHAFDVLVQSSDYEGTPTVVVEAMAMGIPIVATDVGGTGQLIEHQRHGLLVPPRRPDLLCRGIEQTINDPASTQQRVQAARERVETELSFRHRVEQLQRIYQELIEPNLEARATRDEADSVSRTR